MNKKLPKNFLTNKADIISWLEAHEISDYILVEDKKYGWAVNAQGDVILNLKTNGFQSSFDSIGVKFNLVMGKFDCSSNKLKSLEGSPNIVRGTFNCDVNYLTDLVDGPVEVGQYYYCAHNDLISLKGAPKIIYKDFDCGDNRLSNLEHCPEEISGDLYCGNNELNTLAFFPQKLGLDCYIQSNPQLNLNRPMYWNEDIMPLHIMAREKYNLDLELPSASNVNLPKHKI